MESLTAIIKIFKRPLFKLTSDVFREKCATTLVRKLNFKVGLRGLKLVFYDSKLREFSENILCDAQKWSVLLLQKLKYPQQITLFLLNNGSGAIFNRFGPGFFLFSQVCHIESFILTPYLPYLDQVLAPGCLVRGQNRPHDFRKFRAFYPEEPEEAKNLSAGT